MVFYRKYRPQTILELDSATIREKLYSVFSSSSVPHAFLFTGPKGLGKTSTARIVAKIVNCEQNQGKREKGKGKETIEPCNTCEQCISITNGTNLDVLEIDGASNRGIDEIRDLREKVRLSPLKASKKVYIIDEVHMLTTEAFNALLKTLEEPPSHVLFILCTTESHKVPATIASRCFHIPFTIASEKELVSSFARIVKNEHININKDALLYITRLADGSFRDGAKILEELSVVSDKEITVDVVEQKYNIASVDYHLQQLLKSLSKKDTKASLQIISQIVDQGMDMKYVLEQLITKFHVLLLQHVGVVESKEEALFTIEEIKKVIVLITQAHSQLKYTVVPSLPLELVVIEWSMHDESRIPSLLNTQIPQAASTSGTTPVWTEFISKVKTHNHSLAGILRGCLLKSYNKKEFVIETAYTFHKDKLLQEKNIELLEKVAQEVTGNSVEVSVLLRE